MSIAWDYLTPLQRAQLKTFGFYQENRRSRGWILNGCPKCGGDLMPDQDDYEEYHTCLNCGCNKYYHAPLKHPYEKAGRPPSIR